MVFRSLNRIFVPMIIGFDAKRIVRNGTGLGSYSRTLVNNLIVQCPEDTELRLYAPDKGIDALRNQIKSGVTWCYPSLFSPLSSLLSPLMKPYWRSHGIVNDLKRDGVEVFHGLSGELPIGLRKAGIKGVVTIHDLIFLRHPEWYNPVDVMFYKWKFHKTLKEATKIIAISECTKRDIIHYGDIDPERIEIIYQSFSPQFKQNSSPQNNTASEENSSLFTLHSSLKRYILSVGTVEERKNLGLAVKALDYLPDNVHLVAVGRQTDYAKSLPKHSRLHLMGQLPIEELTALYDGAEAFVYPSRYEGFGIPIIEAISRGLPVVACTGSCLEEAGGPDSIYVDPDDAQAMANAIKSVLKGAPDREQRIERSKEYIKRFEGNDVAAQVMQLYQNL